MLRVTTASRVNTCRRPQAQRAAALADLPTLIYMANNAKHLRLCISQSDLSNMELTHWTLQCNLETHIMHPQLHLESLRTKV